MPCIQGHATVTQNAWVSGARDWRIEQVEQRVGIRQSEISTAGRFDSLMFMPLLCVSPHLSSPGQLVQARPVATVPN